jgi:hypothetical protein
MSQSAEDHKNGIFASISLVGDILSQSKLANGENSSLFSVLDLDPLASLDPAARELTQTRLFGERALFVGNHMPQIMEWQAELLSMRTLRNPSIEQLIVDTGRLTQTAEQMGNSLSQVPGVIADERKEIVRAIQNQTPQLLALSTEITAAFQEGQKMADSINGILSKYEAISAKSQNDDSSQSLPASQYLEVLTRLESTLERINTLTSSLTGVIDNEERMKSYTALGQEVRGNVRAASESIVDYAFLRLMIFATFCFSMIGGLIYFNARLKT